jgi:hypothetical protein
MPGETELLKQLYDRFNARDIEAVLLMLDSGVMWANGMEGGHVRGRDAVRSYWTRQWAMIDPHVEPTAFSVAADGVTTVEVRQTVRDFSGNILSEKIVGHIFEMHDSLIKRFDIR